MIKTGKFIALLRQEKGMTQEELGERLGITNKTVSRWETGKYAPGIDALEELGKIFGVSINELISGERLDDRAFRRKADEITAKLSRESCFSRKEQEDFWRKKWQREHRALLVLCVLISVLLLVYLIYRGEALLAGLWPTAALTEFALIRNKMMIYVENKLYDE